MLIRALLTLLLMLASAIALANPSLVVQRVNEVPSELTPAFMRGADVSEVLTTLPGLALLQAPAARSVYRLRVGEHPALTQGQALLVIKETVDQPVRIYLPPDFRKFEANLASGSYRSIYPRDVIAVELPASMRAGDYIWLEVLSPRAATITVDIRERSELAQIALNSVRFYTAMMVLMLACCGIALCFFLVLREPIWLLYLAKVFCYWIYTGARTGELASIADGFGLPQIVPALGMPSGNTAAMLGAAFSAFFALHFLNLHRIAPGIAKTLYALGWGMVCLAPILFVLSVQISPLVRISNLLLILNTVLIVLGSIKAIRAGNRLAFFLLLADLPIVLTLFLQIAAVVGWITFAGLSNQLFMASHAFAGVVVSLVLAYKVLGYREERDAAISSSERDPLTGALNRRAATHALESMLSTLDKGRSSIAVCFLDLDYFKRVNDRFGHQVGDDVLRFFVNQVQPDMRSSDVFARMGGEEFVLILPGAQLKDGLAIAERIRARVQENGKIIEGCAVGLTISIGVSASTPFLRTPQAMLDAADRALYHAKENGRNRVQSMDIVDVQSKGSEAA
jgi:diguanylate cyclase (GGDEF)-like protein